MVRCLILSGVSRKPSVCHRQRVMINSQICRLDGTHPGGRPAPNPWPAADWQAGAEGSRGVDRAVPGPRAGVRAGIAVSASGWNLAPGGLGGSRSTPRAAARASAHRVAPLCLRQSGADHRRGRSRAAGRWPGRVDRNDASRRSGWPAPPAGGSSPRRHAQAAAADGGRRGRAVRRHRGRCRCRAGSFDHVGESGRAAFGARDATGTAHHRSAHHDRDAHPHRRHRRADVGERPGRRARSGSRVDAPPR